MTSQTGFPTPGAAGQGSKGGFVRALRGPVLLITLGILLVLQQNDLASLGNTWPAFLIVGGLMWLLERALGTPEPVYTGPYPETYRTGAGGSYSGGVYNPSPTSSATASSTPMATSVPPSSYVPTGYQAMYQTPNQGVNQAPNQGAADTPANQPSDSGAAQQ